MAKQFDVTALGELLVDFTQTGLSPQHNPVFEANPGGAPANVLAMLRKLGRRCAFLGKVGADSFGELLASTVSATGVDVQGLVRDENIPTTLALVRTFENGDRDFSFYRKPGADMMLREDELARDKIEGCRIFHFGTLSLTDEPVATATKTAVALAKKSGAIISFDPNWRPPLWRSEEEGKAAIRWGLGQCDVLKIADNELLLMTGEEDFDAGAAQLLRDYPNIKLLNVTAGGDGSHSYYGGKTVFVDACKRGGVIETTGAGDTFCACVLNFVLEHGLDGLTESDLRAMLAFANTAAYIVTTRRGAIPSMPEREEVEAILAEESRK